MAVVCFRKPEVVITQPWIEIYQTNAVSKHANGMKFATPWPPSWEMDMTLQLRPREV